LWLHPRTANRFADENRAAGEPNPSSHQTNNLRAIIPGNPCEAIRIRPISYPPARAIGGYWLYAKKFFSIHRLHTSQVAFVENSWIRMPPPTLEKRRVSVLITQETREDGALSGHPVYFHKPAIHSPPMQFPKK